MAEVKDIPIGKIKVGEHVQRMGGEDEGIGELAESIRRVGLVNPLVVVPDGENFLVVAGHRRLEACRIAGLRQVHCCVQLLAGAETTEISFAENLFRKDLSPLELGCAIKDCIDNKVMTVSELAGGLHRSAEWVRRMIALTSWPDDVLKALHSGAVSVAAAHNLALVDNDTYRAFLVRNAVEQGATARTTAAWLQAYRAMQPAELAVTAEPEAGRPPTQPIVPQAPCLCCSNIFRTDELSHVPICPSCIQAIRSIGVGGT